MRSSCVSCIERTASQGGAALAAPFLCARSDCLIAPAVLYRKDRMCPPYQFIFFEPVAAETLAISVTVRGDTPPLADGILMHNKNG